MNLICVNYDKNTFTVMKKYTKSKFIICYITWESREWGTMATAHLFPTKCHLKGQLRHFEGHLNE